MQHNVNEPDAIGAVSRLLNSLGIDRRDPNFKETPRRVYQMWSTWLRPQSLTIKSFESPNDQMVLLSGHKAISVCPHHLLPFEIVADLGYVPDGHVIGLSKLARLIDFAAGSFLLQENITQLVAELLQTLLLPKGVICRIAGTHGCMRLRGVKTEGYVTTTALKGVFKTDLQARQEFLLTCQQNKR